MNKKYYKMFNNLKNFNNNSINNKIISIKIKIIMKQI